MNFLIRIERDHLPCFRMDESLYLEDIVYRKMLIEVIQTDGFVYWNGQEFSSKSGDKLEAYYPITLV